MSGLVAYNIAEWVVRAVMLLVILRRRFTPVVSLAWLAVVFLQPMLGLLLYLLFGDHRLARRRVRRYQQIVQVRRPGEVAELWASHVIRPEVEPAQMPVILQAEQITGMPILGGNAVEILTDNSEFIDAMIRDIDRAKHHVHMLFYIFEPDESGRKVARALIDAERRGVECRVLADAAGSRRFWRSDVDRELRAGGIEVHPALPVAPFRRGLERLDLRNHRKLAVIDGTIAYTGSHNVVKPEFGHRRAGQWNDLSGRFTGPIVGQFQSVFLEDWLFETGKSLDDPSVYPPLSPVGAMAAQAVPSGPADDAETFQRVLLAAMNVAERKLTITTPYLILDEPTLVAIEMAAARGVEINLVLPDKSDHPLVDLASRAHFEGLLSAGVNIHLHQTGLLHAKTMTVDDTLALLGSSNLDVRSFHLNFELNVLMYGPDITRKLRFAQTRYISESQPLTLDQWRRRSISVRYVHSAAALLGPLL